MNERGQQQKPYKGLVPYSEEDAHYFFGRERDCKIIIANLMASRLTLLYGATGVGKSSVLRAGVGHTLSNLADQNRETFGTPEYLGINFSSWRDDPVSGLLRRVQESVERFSSAKLGPIVSPSPLTESLQACASHVKATLLIILDQFEEYFLYQPRESEQGSFAIEFARAVNNSKLAANFVISIREDALAKLDKFREYIPNLFENYLRLDQLDQNAAHEAIARPIDEYNRIYGGDKPFTIEPDLIQEVLHGAKTGQQIFSGSGLGAVATQSRDERIETPLLQIIMTRLWDEEWQRGSRQLRLQTLHELRGTAEIIKTHLDLAMADLNRDEQRTASRIFNQLVTPSGTKIAHTSADLASYSEQPQASVAQVLEKLASGDARLLRTVPAPFNQASAPARYEIFHDVLAIPVLEWRRRFELEEEREKASRIVREYVDPLGDVKVVESALKERVRDEMALSLSGGGYRGMLFNLGSLWRLNELGLLKRITRISSVSGGAIAAGTLGLAWKQLDFNASGSASNLEQLVVNPIRSLARATIDQASIIKGILLPKHSPSDDVAEALRRYIFEEATLQDLPAEGEGPLFIITAANVQSKALWRFSKPYMGDYRVGLIRNPRTKLAVAVGASAAIPPFLSPAIMDLNPAEFEPPGDLGFEPYTSSIVLTDGAVYDIFGLETVWKAYQTILVSDGAGASVAQPEPPKDWARHTSSLLDLIGNQVRGVRKRQIVDSYHMNLRRGAYWGMQTDILNYQLPSAMPCPYETTVVLAQTPTRFKALDATLQERIINWGYAVCDAAIRTHLDRTAPAPISFPYPRSGVG